jgi:Putative adhesin
VTLMNIAGSAVAHALNGKLTASFTRVNQKPMAFSSLNGDIDVTFPADLKANVSLRSDRGDVFSDFDVNMQALSSQAVVDDARSHGGKYKVKIDKTVRGTINGGGPEMQFNNFNGQIYIRKAGGK